MKFSQSEEQIMKYLWKLDHAYMKDIVDEFPTPKPAYTTVATIISRMIKKGYVGYHQRGSVREYFPKVKKTEYSNQSLHKLMEGYFQGSFKSMVSFFMKKNDISIQEMETIMEEINSEKNGK